MNAMSQTGHPTVEVDDMVSRAAEAVSALQSLGGRRKDSIEVLVAEMIRLNETNLSLREQLATSQASLSNEQARANTAEASHGTLLTQHRRLVGAFDQFVEQVNASSQGLIDDDRKINSIVALTDSKRAYGSEPPQGYTSHIPGRHAEFMRTFTSDAPLALSAETVVADESGEEGSPSPAIEDADAERGVIRNVLAGFVGLARGSVPAEASA